MVEEDREEFSRIMGSVYDFWNRELSDSSLEIWWLALAGYDLEAVRVALTRHMRNPDSGQFLPKPADVVRELGGNTQDASMLAWARVVDAVRSVGPHRSIDFADPMAHQAIVDMGGWAWLCSQTEKEWPFVERRFRDAYRAYLRRGANDAAPTYLPGLVEIHNAGQFPQYVEPPIKLKPSQLRLEEK